MMQKNKVSLEWNLDERLYQFVCPSEGNWQEVELFALDIAKLARNNIDIAKKVEQEKKDAEEPKSE